MVSFLKAMYGEAATKENDFAFNYLPKIDRKYSWVENWNDMYEGKVKGLFAFGMNGVMIGPDSQEEHRRAEEGRLPGGVRNLSRRDQRLLGGAGHYARGDEADQHHGLSAAGRGLRRKGRNVGQFGALAAVEECRCPAAGRCRLDQDILAQIFLKIRELYKKEGGKFPDPILNATWTYTIPTNPSLSEVAKEINGKAIADISDEKTNLSLKAGQQLPGFAALRDDGTTSSGNWIYCGSWTEAGAADAAARHRRSFGPGHLSELGMVVADESPRAVQPRLVRSRRQALGSLAQASLVERDGARSGWATTFPTSSPTPSPRSTWARSS